MGNYFDKFDPQPQPQVAQMQPPAGFPATPPVGFPVQQPQQQPNYFDQFDNVAAAPAPSANKFSLGASVQNWVNEQPIVKDWQRAGQTNGWGNFAGSMFTGLPAGPLDLVDTVTGANNWVNDQFVNPAVQWGIPRDLAEPIVQAVNPLGRKTDFANQYKQMVKPSMPGAFGGGQFIGGALVPMGGVSKTASVGRQILQGAGLSGGVSAIQDIGNQYRTTGKVNPMQVAGATALGSLLGGSVPAVGGAIAKFFKKGPQVEPQFGPPLPPRQPEGQLKLQLVPQQAANQDAQAAAQQFFKALGMDVDNLDPETAAAAQQMTGHTQHQAPPVAHAQPPAKPLPEYHQPHPPEVEQAIARRNTADINKYPASWEEFDLDFKGRSLVESTSEVEKGLARERGRTISPHALSHEDLAGYLQAAKERLAQAKPASKAKYQKMRKALEGEVQRRKEWAADGLPDEYAPQAKQIEKLSDEDLTSLYHQGSPQQRADATAEMDRRYAAEIADAEAAAVVPRGYQHVDDGIVGGRYSNAHSRAAQAEMAVDKKLDDVAKATEPAEAEKAIKEWAEAALGADDAGAIIAGKTVGDFRRTIKPEFHGRNKNKLAEDLHGHPLLDSRKSRTIFQSLGRAKVAIDHAQAIEDDFKQRFVDKFVDKEAKSYTAANGMKLNKTVKQQHSKETLAEIDQLRDDMTDGVEPAKSVTLSGLVTQKFDNNPNGAKFAREAMPDDLVSAENKLNELARKRLELQKAYGRLKISGEHGAREIKAKAEEALKAAKEQKANAVKALKEKIDDPSVKQKAKDALADKVEAAQKKLDAASDKLAEAEKTFKQAQEIEDHFAHLEEIQIKAKKDPTANIHIKGMVPHPVEGQPPVEVSIEFRKGAMVRTRTEGLQAEYEAAKKLIESQDLNRTPRDVWKVTTSRKAGFAAIAGSIYSAVASLPAHAANAMPMQVMSAWDYMPIPEMVGGLVALHGIAPKVAKAVLSEKNFKVGAWFKDTMDNIEYLEKSKVIPAGLVHEVWNHQAQVLKSQKGVKIDEELKAKCIESLREGKDFKTGKDITVKNCLERTPDTVFEGLENEAQAHALTMHKIAQDNLAKITRKADKQLGEWLEMAQAKDEKTQEKFKAWLQENKMEVAPNIAAVKSAREAMSHMLNQLSPRGEILNDVDRLVQRGKSNFMEAAFGQNLEFSGTNIGDLLISGGAYAGPINVLRATNLVNFNKEFRALLHDSHFAGGFQVDRTESAALAGGVAKKKLPWDKDFKSDLFNANRLAVASLLQHAQINKELLAESGFHGSDVDFAKAVLSGSADLDDVIGADAYIHMAKALSRVLSMDILKVNTDIMSRSRFGTVAGVFFKQPARMARLAMNYLANGEFMKMYTLLGFTALFGGSAAIPQELATVGQVINPDAYFKAANAFDQIDMYQKVTGEKLTPKIQWSMFWVSMAGQNPVWQNISDAAKNFGEGYFDNKPIKFWKGALKLLPIAAPKVAGISTRNIVNAGNYGYEAVTGKDTLYGTNAIGVFDPEATKQVTLDRIKKHPLVHFLSQYVPGKSSAEYQNTMSSREHDARRAAIPKNVPGITGKRPGNAQFYEPKNIYNQPDPASWFLRGGR